ncbi:MAG: hypothetical protein JNK04_03550 [Myxococcales bacterium]|nr:hypothetical protein [Myxococcales bacterium]
MRSSAFGRRCGLLAILCAFGLSCGSGDRKPEKEEWGTPGKPRPLTEEEMEADEPPPDVAKLIFLVSVQRRLYSFSPTTPGLAAYHEIGKLDCPGGGNPQSMAIDRNGIAWVFYDSRQLYRVNTANAKCEATGYKHPSFHYQLGMGFTSTTPKSQSEQLFIQSPHFGLGTLAFPSLDVSKTGYFANTAAELTGGGDGKLFMFQSEGAQLSEVSRTDFSLRPIHKFERMGYVSAWAFARYAGKFYVFTSGPDLRGSRTTIYDPARNAESVRDDNIGFVVVGAGQSTLVPPSDQSADIAGEDPPPLAPTQSPNVPPAPQPRPQVDPNAPRTL